MNCKQYHEGPKAVGLYGIDIYQGETGQAFWIIFHCKKGISDVAWILHCGLLQIQCWKLNTLRWKLLVISQNWCCWVTKRYFQIEIFNSIKRPDIKWSLKHSWAVNYAEQYCKQNWVNLLNCPCTFESKCFRLRDIIKK